MKHKSFTEVIPIIFLILLVLILFKQVPLEAGLYWQSALPPPTPNPYSVFSSTGGRIYCGLQQGPVWLDIPKGFTSEWGAEIHCDPTPVLLSQSQPGWPSATGAWDDKGYLIGVYPPAPLLKSLTLTFEIDPARASGICEDCFIARYYDPESRQWWDLPTIYEESLSRVFVEIAKYLPRSKYHEYEDRFLIALFVRSKATPTFTPTFVSVPTFTPSPTLTPSPTPSPTLTSPSPTLTSPPTPTSKPLPTSSPTLTTVSPSPSPAVIETPTLIPPTQEQPPAPEQPPTPTTKILLILVVILGIGVLILGVIIIVLLLGQHKSGGRV